MGRTHVEPATGPPGARPVPLESILFTEELSRRPSRPPDYEAENRALSALARALADAPNTILQALADTILEVSGADSAGLSLLSSDEGGQRFYWPAIAGAWKQHVGGVTPRDFGPSGDVLDRDAPLLFKRFERRYAYLESATPAAEEALLVPFHVGGRAVGTIWAMTHDDRLEFDAEHLRQLESMGRFASAAYQAVELRKREDSRLAALNLMEDAVRARRETAMKVAELREGENRLRRSVADLADADRRKSEFMATLAHELRNPLAPIQNALDILRLSSDDPDAQAAARHMAELQVSHMVHMIDDLLDVSRISRGRIELRKEPVDLAALARAAVEVTRPACERKGVELAMTLPHKPVILDVDPTRLAQVLENLLRNACKFTPRGGRVSLHAHQHDGDAVIRVTDTGIGISAEFLPHVFDMFEQGDTSLERTAGGLGIGLTLVKDLVGRHGGTVQARSAGVGHGSEFEVRLPVGADVPLPIPTERLPEPTTAGRRILVVDDNGDAARSTAILLEHFGNETREAHDGVEAVEAAQAFQPDLVLLDIGLPMLNGYDVARRIRAQSWGADMVLVALTGWGQPEDRKKSKEAGFDEHLVKPVDHTTLLRLLASYPVSDAQADGGERPHTGDGVAPHGGAGG